MTPETILAAPQRALPTRLTPEVRFWLFVLAIVAGLDSAAFLGLPTFIESNAYDGARSIAPQWFWGIIAGVGSSGCMTAFTGDLGLRRIPDRWNHHLWWIRSSSTTIGLAAYGALCGVFGTSILALSLTGSVSAITGTTKWWLALIACGRALWVGRT